MTGLWGRGGTARSERCSYDSLWAGRVWVPETRVEPVGRSRSGACNVDSRDVMRETGGLEKCAAKPVARGDVLGERGQETAAARRTPAWAPRGDEAASWEGPSAQDVVPTPQSAAAVSRSGGVCRQQALG